MQLNASPRTDVWGHTPLEHLPPRSGASSPDPRQGGGLPGPVMATEPPLLRAWLQAPFPPSSRTVPALSSSAARSGLAP